MIFLVAGCISPKATQGTMHITVKADGKNTEADVPAGSTVQEALSKAGIAVSNLDRTKPALYTVLTDGSVIELTRVKETFEVKEETITFQRQLVHNESLPQGEERLIQPGVNGAREITYRIVSENGVEISNSMFKTMIVKEAIPEIVMVGVQAPFASIDIPGRLAYLTAGNAWIMDGSTGSRRPVVTTGDLDGHIFSLSPDGGWLLFSRKSTQTNQINSLWVVQVPAGQNQTPKLVDLKVNNIINFADWIPNSFGVAYSTVEPRSTAPGWQANNDLFILKLNPNGTPARSEQVLESNSGGIYGWWGTTFVWSPDGKQMAYTRPDGVGLVDFDNARLDPLLDITPLQTRSDWAWTPGLSWGSDGTVLYTVTHAPSSGLVSAEESPIFDLMAISIKGAPPVALALKSGMFAYPVASPWISPQGFQVAYLQAIFPDQSETSRYRIVIMDRDGSNRTPIFPAEGLPGVEPQEVTWSPKPFTQGAFWLATLYQGNLWLTDSTGGQSQQITGDGLTIRIDWK